MPTLTSQQGIDTIYGDVFNEQINLSCLHSTKSLSEKY